MDHVWQRLSTRGWVGSGWLLRGPRRRDLKRANGWLTCLSSPACASALERKRDHRDVGPFTPQNWNTWQSVAIPTTTDTDSHEDCSILTIKPVHLENEGGIIWGPLFDVCATEASTAPMSGQMSEPTEPGEMIWPPVQFLSEAASQFYESAETAPATWQRISPEVTSRTATSLDLSWAPSPGADGYEPVTVTLGTAEARIPPGPPVTPGGIPR